MSRHRNTLVFLLLCTLLLLLTAADAAASHRRIIWDPDATPSWSVSRTGIAASSEDAARHVAMTGGGVTWVCGSIEDEADNVDLSLTRIVNGVHKWTKVYDAFGKDDAAERLALGPGGVVYTAGWSYRGAASDLLLVKWSSSGAILWQRRYDTGASLGEWGSGVVVDKAGNVTVCGYASGATTSSWLMRSYSPSGKVRWTWRYAPGADARAFPFDACVSADGSVYTTGYLIKSGVTAAMTVRISQTGKKLWVKTTRGAEGRGAATMALAPCPSGGVYVCGTVGTAADQDDGLVMRYAPNGTRKVFVLDNAGGGAHGEWFNDVAVTSTKKVVAVGSSTANGSQDCRAVTYGSDGSLAGGITFPGTNGHEEFRCVAADAYGGFVAAGSWWNSGTNRQLCVIRGSTLAGGGGWSAVFDGVDSTLAGANAVDARGNAVVVAGQYVAGASGTDQIVLGFVY